MSRIELSIVPSPAAAGLRSRAARTAQPRRVARGTRARGAGVRRPAALAPAPAPPSERRPRVAVAEVPVARAADLEPFVADWHDLARHAAEPNVFYEPWMVLPAIDAYGAGHCLRFVFVYELRDGEPPLLCGVFPLEQLRRFRALPVPVVRLWSWVHCFLGTPLVRDGHVRSTLATFLCWLRRDPRARGLLEMPQCAADGPVLAALVGLLRASASPFAARRWERAVISPRGAGEAYLEEALRGKRRKEVRRLERRLADLGRVTVDAVDPATARPAGAALRWAEEFLALEAAGWKGRKGTALACRAADRAFFRQILAAAEERGRLQTLALRLDGRPVAMKCNFLAGDGGFAFKIAFDEDHARLSPGYLLEIETIRRLHRLPAVRWMDSCAVPGHPMADRLWTDRRAIASVLVATGGPAARLLVPALSLARRLAPSEWRGRTPTPPQEE